jgi:HD-GYP domain-containing protein (c-di-GMP phosphodiesterase class II)
MFDKLKSYVTNNFEQTFVVVVIVVMLITGLFVPYKQAMLHFFYLPVMLAGFVLGRKKALQGAVLIILGMTSYVAFQLDEFTMGGKAVADGILSLVTWAGFLVLSGYVVGLIRDRSEQEKRKATQLNVELKKMFEEGQKAFLDKKQFNKDLAQSQKRVEELDIVVKGLREKMLENLISTMDARVANLLFERKLRDDRREISVLSAALANFNPYIAKKQPRTVAQTMGQFLSEMEQVLTDFHAHIEDYSGGAIMCEFGVPVEYETHAILAVVAAIRMQEQLKKVQFPWDIQIGIASGTSVTALLGKNRRSYTALGLPSENALKLRMACKPGCILIDPECYSKVSYCIEAKLVQDKDGAIDEGIGKEIDRLEGKLAGNAKDIEALHQLGEIYLKKLHQPTRALKLFERALKIGPDNTKVKLAYAEANIEKESLTRISEAGPGAFTAYEVVGTRNPIFDENRLPAKFAERYASVENLIGIPAELILPIEAIDGSIGHSRVVAVLSYAMAETLGLSEEQKKDVLMAGYIQDIGKKLIPHQILSHTRKLTNEEFAEVRRHPTEATRVLSSAGFNKISILEIVEHHHERHNGKGYPHGKSGNQIPVGARITAVADSYDAMVAWRPYKKARTRTDALSEIKRGARSGFYDPTVVQAFLTVIDGT